jgi:hypothetical protein
MLGKPEAANSSAAIPRPQALSGAEIDPPLDLVHLARHCMGDRELEDELLRLFLAQSQTLLAQLREPPRISLELKAKIAHKMRGSALAVGARRVASAALRVEELALAAADGSIQAHASRPTPEEDALSGLLASVTEAIAEVERLRE